MTTEFQDGPWCNPHCTTPIPWSARCDVALAAENLCKALSERSDSPSEFVRRVRDAVRCLDDFRADIIAFWPKEETTPPTP